MTPLQLKKGKVLLFLYGGYHSKCNITMTMLDEIQLKRPDISVIKIDTSKSYSIKEEYNIKALPALVYLINGQLAGKLSGTLSYREVLSMIEGCD